MTRNVDPKKASRYIIKSEEFLGTANIALQSAKYNSAVTNAIHSAIIVAIKSSCKIIRLFC